MDHDPGSQGGGRAHDEDAAATLLRAVRARVDDVSGGLVAQLAALVGDQPVDYVSTDVTRNAHGDLEGTLAVFTATTLFVQRATPTASGTALSSTVVARRALRRLETSEEDYLDAPGEARWPTGGRVIATYETLTRGLQLPLGARSGEDDAAFAAFLPGLVADLAPARP